jgi:hypothetical protein
LIIFGIYLWGNMEIVNILAVFVIMVSGIFAIPAGILSIIVGIKLWRGAKNLENYTNTENEEDLKESLKNLSDYFKWYGWLIALSLAISALVLIAILVLMIVGIGIFSMSGLE